MIKRILNHSLFQIALTGAILLGALMCVFPQLIPRFSWVVNYAVQLMLFYLFAGMVMLALSQPRLTFAFFGGCVLLCFFLKFSVKGDGIDRWRQNIMKKEPSGISSLKPAPIEFKFAQINLTNTDNPAEMLSMLHSTKADIISLHEVTPANEQLLKDSLSANYPFSHTMVDIGLFGMSIYSKFELLDIDTIFYNEIPNLAGSIKIQNSSFDFVSIHTMPALDAYTAKRMREHLDTIASNISSKKEPLLVFGDFNAVSWSSQVQLLLDKAGLLESRLGFMPSSFSGKFPFWDIPLDHIFYSGHFVCKGFQNINGYAGEHVGIIGTYQLTESPNNAEKTDQ